MPAVGPQGSRGGLIAAVVVFTILFVTATIFAIYFGVDDSKKTELLQVQTDRTKSIYSAQDVASQRYTEAAKSTRPGQTILAASFQDSQSLAEVIAGKHAVFAKTPTAAALEAKNAIKAIGQNDKLKTLNITPDMDLVSVLNKLAAYSADQVYQNTALRKSAGQAAGDAATQIALAQQLTQKANEDRDAAVKAKDDALAQQHAFEMSYQDKLQKMSLAMDGERKNMNSELQKAQTSLEEKDREIVESKRAATALVDKLAKRRVSPLDPLLRQTDGFINSVATADIVYINLGDGDHIVPGMTFEVYSRRQGIPKQEDLMDADNMPVGIASIEVEKVLNGVSQCRVIKTEVGQHIGEGDLIANLVYDRNTKYNMVVYGDFNLSGNDLARRPEQAKGDQQKIKALITAWGGQIQKDINVDTDFVVMGAEPKVEQLTPDDHDPLDIQVHQDQQAAYDAYQAELTKAQNLGIPIMNQNRFLYFCGYYDNAQR
jgi:hypothetical protein